jgi:hypothetical protein
VRGPPEPEKLSTDGCGPCGEEPPVYALIWRRLPGPLWMKLACAVVLVSLLVVLLFGWVFPWAEPYLPFSGSGTIGGN